MHNFKELVVWQKSKILVKDIYLLTRKFPDFERFGLMSQIQRASISIPSNIAEGSGRSSKKDFARFLEIAWSSSFEVENHLIISRDLEYITEIELKEFSKKIEEVQKMLYSFINKIKKEAR